MMALMPMTAKAQGNVINTVVSSEELTKSSTVYVGEVVVDGVSEIKFLYSGDITLNNTLLQNLLDGLNGMADGDYAALLEAYKVNAYFYLPEERLALCSNPDLVAAMDANWSSALYVGTLYYADKSVVSDINSNLYDLDAGFKAVLDAKTAERIEDIESIIDAPKCIVTHLGADATNNVWYTVENDQVIKHVETSIVYSSEVTTVIYTKVELETLIMETPLTFEAVEAGTITVNLDEGATLEAIQYKLNDAEWTDVTWGEAIDLDAHDVISFRGNNGTCNEGEDSWVGFHFEPSNPVYVYGNMMSLIDKDGFATNTTLTEPFTFFHLFQTSDYEPNNTILNHPTKDIVLPATTLTANCYDGLFDGCRGITRATELPATTLADWCYCMMFSGTGITTAPALPATTLAEACYADMFMNCTNLTTAPDLPAATLAEGCYTDMFSGCTSLNYVKCLATDISADYCTSDWLWGVAETGTFVKSAIMEDWALNDPSGIPEGWNVENIDVFTTDGNWDVAANWSGNVVPADGSDVVIAANATIPANYVAHAGEISINAGATLTIADGGQLYHNNDGVTATIKKNITAYSTETGVNNGWHLIGHSFADNGTIDEMDNLTANDYDLYYYDEPTHYWKNQKNAANNFTELEAARGYLYANSASQTIGLKGTLNAANAMVTIPLSYEADALKGFNLVGNPFAHNVTTFTGTNVATEVYRMNGTKDNLIVSTISETDPLTPGEGFFVKATGDGASITFNAQTRGESKATELVEVPTLTIDLLQDGLTIDRLVVKHEGEPLEKFTLRENGTRIYATEGGKDYAVVTVISSDSEANQTEIPVNFKAAKNGTYTISVNLENTDFGYLHLIDNLTGTDVDLLAPVIARNDAIQGTASYTFHAKTTDYASRFRLVFSVCGDANDDNEPFAYVDAAGNIIVNGGSSTGLETLQVVDVMGRVIVQGDAMNRVSTSGMTPGIYVLRLINGNDVRTQKTVVR